MNKEKTLTPEESESSIMARLLLKHVDDPERIKSFLREVKENGIILSNANRKVDTPEEDLINIIKKHIPNGCINLKSYGQELGMISKCMREYGQQEYNRGKTEAQQWISVDERLPEEGELIWSIGDGKRPTISKYTNGRFERFVDSIEGERVYVIYYTHITHWMPYHPPPLKERRNKHEKFINKNQK